MLAAVGALGGRVDGLTERVDGLNERMDGLNERFDGLTERFDGLTERMQTVEIKTDANREAINALGERLAGFQTETRTHFEAVEQKIDDLDQKSDSRYHEATGRFNAVDEQLAEIKDLIVDRFGGGR